MQARLLDALGQPTIATDTDGRVVYWNRAAEEMYGWSAEEAAGRNLSEMLVPEDLREQAGEILSGNLEGSRWSGEFLVRRRDGTALPVMATNAPVRDEQGDLFGIVGVSTDISDRKEAEEALARSEASLAESQRIAHLGTWEWDVITGDVWWSDETYRIYGFEPGQVTPSLQRLLEAVHPDDKSLLEAAIEAALHQHKPYDFEHRIVRPDGKERWVHRQAEVVRGKDEAPLKMMGTIHDVTERKQAEERLTHRAFHDPLTGLPNRRLFVDRLEHALSRTRRRRGSKVAVLFMDMDGFKVVNDSLGHESGDRMLVAVSERLREIVRPEDALARFGGDEFVVLLEDVEDAAEAVRVAERVVREFEQPFLMDGREIFVSASIGIGLGDGHTKSPEELLRDADTAMYRAKAEATADHRVFDPEMHEQVVERLDLENDLRRAVEAGEFVVNYQPIVRLHTNQVWGLEALVRWDHPHRGMLDPEEFVAVAEQSGLIVHIGRWVLEEACEQAVRWQEKYPSTPPLVMSVNLSAHQLRRPDLADVVTRVLRQSGLGASCLSLDLTETVYISALHSDTAVLERIKDMGIKLSIDDFGIGYSSLAYLKRLPAEILKIDKSFVVGLGLEAEDTAIAQTIIALAHILGMEVVAEGVESGEQAALLREMGCDFAQGYHFAGPRPAEEITRLLAEG